MVLRRSTFTCSVQADVRVVITRQRRAGDVPFFSQAPVGRQPLGQGFSNLWAHRSKCRQCLRGQQPSKLAV